MRAIVLVICFAFPLCGCQPWIFISYRIRPNPPPYQGEMRLEGLHSPVTAVFDQFAIPHIEAQAEGDLYFTVGYLHARERLFQMELLRRASLGRLAEVFGNKADKKNLIFTDTLAIDRWMRTIGFGRVAGQAVEGMDPESRAVVEAYVAGVNAHIQSGELPIECKLLKFKPEPWEASHVVAVARLIGWGISFNHVQELIRYLLRAELSADQQMEIFPPLEHPGPYIIPREEKDYRKISAQGTDAHTIPPPYTQWREAAQQVLAGLTDLRQLVWAIVPPEASNSWVLGPSRTASGKAILANDPHLHHTAPGLFYAMHLKAPEIDVIGATLPGTPAILLGHNRHLAWALTTTFADTQDIYLEKVDPEDPGRYVTLHGSEPFQIENHIILEKRKWGGNGEHPFRLRFTSHGPVLNDALEAKLPRETPLLALRSTMEPEAGDLLTLALLAKAKNVDDFKKACQSWSLPVQNWVVADSEGHIGYCPVGKIPKRRGWDGTLPVPGWTREFEWDGYMPLDELPQLFDPASEMIVTANNQVLPASDYPYPFSFDAIPAYRAERIIEMLNEKERWTAEEMRRIQMDVYVKQADRLLPSLLAAVEGVQLSGVEKRALEQLKGWDRFADMKSIGASVFFATYRMAWELTLKDDLSPMLYQLILMNVSCHGFFDRLWAEVPQAKIFDLKDTPAKETRDDILVAAFRAAVKKLRSKFGPDLAKWQWGELHHLTFKHPFGSQGLLAGAFNVGPISLAGARETVWAAAFGWGDDLSFPVLWGPVFRHMYDFGAPEQSGFVLDLGQSGWPGTPHYQNALPDWKEGRLWPASMEGGEYGKKALGILKLTP